MNELIITNEWMRSRDARAIEGARFSEGRGWVLDLDTAPPHSKIALVKLFPEHAPNVSFSTDFLTDIRPIDRATPWYESVPGADSVLINTNVYEILHKYQRVDLAYIYARIMADGAAYNAWDRGLGKTIGAYVLIQALKAKRCCIITPNSSKVPVWMAEPAKWGMDVLVFNLAGGAKARQRTLDTFERMSAKTNASCVLLVHYEALRLVDWNEYPMDFVIVDEAHRLSNGGTVKNKNPKFYNALKSIPTRWKLAMSGSVMVNGPEDIFGALHWLFPDRYAARWKDWNNRFLHWVDGDRGKIMVGVKPDMADAMREELGSIMTMRRKEDELDMPLLVEQHVEVELSTKQRKAYREMAEHFMAELPDGNITIAASRLAQLSKLRQIATGLDLLGENIQDSTKIELAEDMVRDVAPEKTVVFCWHRATVEALGKRLGPAAVMVHGGHSMSMRDEALRRFKDDPTVLAMVATIKTLGESINMQHANHVIFVEMSWVPSDMEQARDRVYRQGQTKRVVLTNICSADTIDTVNILPTVTTKAALKRLILGA